MQTWDGHGTIDAATATLDTYAKFHFEWCGLRETHRSSTSSPNVNVNTLM